jgi:hypothetical protein
MKALEVWIYGVALAIALTLSYTQWKGEEPETKDEVLVFEPGAALSEIRWEGKRDVATLAVEGAGDDAAIWVSAGKRKRIPKVVGPEAPPAAGSEATAGEAAASSAAAEASPGDAGKKPPETKVEKKAEDGQEDEQYGEPELKSFPGNSQAKDVVKAFKPLKALREFQGLDAASIEEMGLDKPEATLFVKAAGKELKLVVGDKAYGSSDSYARVDGGQTVYLISNKVLGPLRSAESRLMERDILGFEATDAASAVLSDGGGRSAQALLQGRHDKANAYWADAGNPDEVDTPLDGVMKKVMQIRASAYLKADEVPAEGSVELVARAAFQGDAGELGWLELGRVVDEKRSKPDEPVWEWYARTPRTREQWVKVPKSNATEVLDSLPAALE